MLLFVLSSPAFAQEVTPVERKAGFFALFNGNDFSGWRFGTESPFKVSPKNWSVGDGVIHLHGGGSPHLASQWPFDDFEMRFQWKALKNGYNSGFYVRSGRKIGANQISLAQKAAGNLMTGVKGGKAVPELQKAPGEWNEWKALAVGDKLSFWCNDQLAWQVIGFKPASGYVGLQAEGAAIDFKNLRVREIDYELLDDPSHWRKEADGSLVLPTKVRDFTLRIEIKGSGGLALGGAEKPQIRLADLKEHINPDGQWNYLQVRVKGGKATLWINGIDVMETIDIGVETAPIRVVPGDARFQMRAARVREAK